MRVFLVGLLLLATPLPGWAEVPALLDEAIRKFAADHHRWAYTQHMVMQDRKGKVKEETVVRFDPSRHYDEQWTLLRKNGREATEAEVKKHRRERAKRAKDRKTLGELLDLPKAALLSETAEEVRFEVPLRQDEDSRLPPEKFQVVIHVDRAAGTLRLIELNLRAAWRVAGVVKIKAGEGWIRFEPVAEGFGPAVTAVSVGGTGSILLIPVGGRSDATRTEFKRVTPYDERFQVQVGPLQTIDF